LEKIRLNIGAGETPIPGFLSIDAKTGDDAFRLPYPDGSVDEVYSSHCLEHLHHTRTLEALTEWVRVLRPGGRLRVAVPDFDRVFAERQAGRMSPQLLAAWMHGSNDHDLDRHRAFLTRDLMMQHLRVCGLEQIADFEPEHGDCSTLPMSLNLEGFKREVRINPRPKVTMVLSTPRVGFIDFYNSVVEVARQLGWNLRDWGGTEWGRGLTAGILHAIGQDDPDYIVTLDYDSVFTADDCRELLRLMQENPDAAAIYPVEAHRHRDQPLGFNNIVPAGYAPGAELTQVMSGHFGLTIIRRQVLDALPHPWFMTLPNSTTLNMADPGGLDADIYFWYQLGLYGFKAFQANNVQIGHMEWCVKWVGKKGILWQPIQHYREHGKPDAARFEADYWIHRARPKAPGRVASELAVQSAVRAATEPAPVELEDSTPPGLRHASAGYPTCCRCGRGVVSDVTLTMGQDELWYHDGPCPVPEPGRSNGSVRQTAEA
jgi:predicted SAM-dependent methyltransferase